MALDDVTEGYLALTARYVEDAGALAGNTFTNLGSWRDEDIDVFIEQLSGPLTGIKSQTSNAVVAYHEKMAGLAKKPFTAPNMADLDLSTAALRNGANVKEVYTRPFVQMRMALAKGEQFSDALLTGSQTATSLARTEVQLSKRKASLFARRANDNIVGYLRTLTGSENCALCYVASTQRYRKGDLMPIHPGCDCGEMPIYGDSDPGQVIDQQLLDKSHQAVEDRFGFSSSTGRGEIDYRKITVRDHGELGPMLTVKGHKFVGPNNLNKVGKAMPKPPALPPVTERVDRIRERASQIDGAVISQAISFQFFRKNLSGDFVKTTGKKRREVVAPTDDMQRHLDDVLDLGKKVDDELSLRVKARIDEVGRDYQKTIIGKEISEAKVRLETATASRVGFYADIEASLEATYRKRFNYDDADILAAKSTQAWRDEVERLAQSNANVLKARQKRENDLIDLIKSLEARLDDEITPGSLAYDTIQREEVRKLIREIRAVGGGTKPSFQGSKPVANILKEAFDEYPDDWVNTFSENYPVLDVRKVQRGFWNSGYSTPRLRISTNPTRIKDLPDGFDTALHEIGHGMEDSVPGLKELEYVFYHRRAQADGYNYNSWSNGREFGSVDDWRQPYTGRDYGAGISNYEIFTTGVESLLGGEGYFGDVLKNQTVDVEFRRFILGVLIGL